MHSKSLFLSITIMPFFACQICYKDLGNADALRKHYDEFEAQEQALYQEYFLCRKHDLSKLNFSEPDPLEPDSDPDAPEPGKPPDDGRERKDPAG